MVKCFAIRAAITTAIQAIHNAKEHGKIPAKEANELVMKLARVADESCKMCLQENKGD